MVDKLLKFIRETKIDLTKAYLVPDGGTAYHDNEFEIAPKDFLRFAKQDLKQNDERGLINSLTNSKRAIDCQVDEVLNKFGIESKDIAVSTQQFLMHFDIKGDVAFKLKIIHALNLAPSTLISKTRTLRNQLEHIYKKPSSNAVKQALDVADLFTRSVEGKLKSLMSDFNLTDKKNYVPKDPWKFQNGLSFSFINSKRYFQVYKIIDTKISGSIKISSKDEAFCGMLRLMFSIDDEVEIEESLKAILKSIRHPIPLEKVKLTQA